MGEGGLRDNFALQVGGMSKAYFHFLLNKFNKSELSRNSSPSHPLN